MTQLYKKYIDVIARFDKFGNIVPLSIIFDTHQYPIDRILEIKQSNSRVGGNGILYKCRIQHQVRHIYLERNRWFIESTKP